MSPCPTIPCADDANISNSQVSTGINSLHLNDATGQGGPADIVLPFGSGAPYTSGNFELTTDIFVITSAYINIQAETVVGQGIGLWALDIQMDALGTLTIDNGGGAVVFLNSTFPQQQWFEFKLSVDLTQNVWEIYINNQSIGNFSNTTNKISSINLYPTVGNDYYIDNICYNYTPYTALAYDMSAIDLDFASYIALSSAPFTVSGDIVNLSSTTITSLDLNYSINGASPIIDNLTGQNLLLFDTLNFNHSVSWIPPSTGTYIIEIWASNLNGNTDLNTTNDIFSKTIIVLSSIPEKITVGEEKTGSWCGWCPRGAVALAEMESTSSFIGIAVHNADPMAISSYDGSLGTYVPGGYPGGGVDRVLAGDPSDFSTMHGARVTETVPCGVNSINASFDGTTNKISVSTEIEAFGEMSGDFRLSCIIVEDDLESTSSGWPQANYYSGGGAGAMAFPSNINGGYDFSAGGQSVQPVDFGGYDHVARSLSSNDILGDVNSLPAGTVTAGIHNYTFADVDITSLVAYSTVGFNWTKAYAVVMIVNATTGEILNAQKEALTSNIANSWECINGDCDDPGTGNGQYSSLSACQATCVTPSWDCDGQGNCSDPATGNGTYSSLSACMAACLSTSINEGNSKLTVYPNPVKDVLTINGDYDSVEIYDIYGKVVLKSNIKKTINVSSLASGIYMLNINTGNKIQTQKITINK